MEVSAKTLLIGIGHPYRLDDGFGPLAIEAIKKVYGDSYDYLKHTGDPASLMDFWDQRSVIILDALHGSGAEPGTIHVIRPLEGRAWPAQRTLSSHALSLAEALEFGQILRKMPRDLLIVAVEADRFEPGSGLSPAVAAAMNEVVTLIPTLNSKRSPRVHESSLMRGLMQQLQILAREYQADRVTAVRVRLGALTHFSREHFLEHFIQASRGTLVEGASLDIEWATDEEDPHAQDIVLKEFDINASR